MSSIAQLYRPQPAVAPYAERRAHRPGKWDRPIERAWGGLAARTGWSQAALRRHADAVAAAGEALRNLSDAALTEHAFGLRTQLLRDGFAGPLVVEAFALVIEATDRRLGMRHHPVQVMGGMAMLHGRLVEMATGEGKTITAMLPAITAALAGIPVHVVTVNDYLARRDAEKLRLVYALLGLDVGLVEHGQDPDVRRAAYCSDVAYCTSKELTFDYLRDRTALHGRRGDARRKVAALFGSDHAPALFLRGLHFAIVDEADSIFIDEARTPLILSAETGAGSAELYADALAIALALVAGDDFSINQSERAIVLTDAGRDRIDALAGAGRDGLWRSRRARVELVSQALSAQHLFHRDRHYIVAEGKVQIVDESTGRVMPDRSWERGLHQMIEVKEGCEVTGGRETIARITYQRFFRRFMRLAGMSGTCLEAAGELSADYGLASVRIPPNRLCIRRQLGTRMCLTQDQKWRLVTERVAALQAAGRPVLIGTRSVAASEEIAGWLERAAIAHVVLNARQDSDEARIIADAGTAGTVTVATNMAGRGTDIVLSEAARDRGGLHVILTEFHDSARIDRQLFGRAGRQGDPGSCEAIVALDDEIFRSFAPAAAAAAARMGSAGEVPAAIAEGLRRRAQGAAGRLHAAIRRQTELMEERLVKMMAFSGEAE